MKYSLKTLMIAVTLFATVGGGRVEYLRRRAAFHEAMAEQQAAAIRGQPGAGVEFMLKFHGTRKSGNPTTGCFVNEQHRLYVRYQDLADDYRRAIFRPWTTIRE